MSMKLFSTRGPIIAGLALALVACGQPPEPSANADEVPATSWSDSVVLFDTDMTMGSRDAPAILVEYGSLTCGGCRAFHELITLPIIKPYTESGDLLYVFREFPTPPEATSIAGSMIARCAGDDKYFDVLDDFFTNQSGLIEAARRGQQRAALEALAGRAGLSPTEMNECLLDAEGQEVIDRSARTGRAAGVDRTPTVFINGEKISYSSPESVQILIDEAIASAQPAPAPAPETDVESDEGDAETETETSDAPETSGDDDAEQE